VDDSGRRAVCFSVLLGGNRSRIAAGVLVLSSFHGGFGPCGGVGGDPVEDLGWGGGWP
jgi:hypothetical protein